jgi:crotonobetainyl-CoA:carnitine CoA-transferase CaiB-like acyl-CoA transferase
VQDGHVGIHVMPKNWPQLLDAIDGQWMATDERFADNRARLQHDGELMAELYNWTGGVTKREAYERGGKARAPIAPVNTIDDLLESEHLNARAFFHEVEHPAAGAMRYPGPPARMRSTPPIRQAPMLGEHNVEVYCDMLGLSPTDLGRLSAAGVI